MTGDQCIRCNNTTLNVGVKLHNHISQQPGTKRVVSHKHNAKQIHFGWNQHYILAVNNMLCFE